MKKRYDVLHIGEANHDISVPDVPYEFLTSRSESFLCGEITDGCGGDALNQAICLANLGDHSAFYGRLSSGYPGTRLRSLLEEHGVDTSLTIMADDCLTPDIIVNIMEDGAHRFLIGKRRGWGLKKNEISREVIRSARILAIGSLYVLDSLDKDGLSDLLILCREEGITVVADMTFDVTGLGPRHYDPIYKYIDYLVPSYTEANYVTGEKDEKKMADFFLSKGARNVLIKLGSRGSYFKNPEKEFYTRTFPVRAVDTTGCGDNFTAGFIHGLLKGFSIEDCAEFGSAAGALNAMKIGANSNIRSEQMVLDFISEIPY